MKTISAPADNEYGEFYAGYINRALARGDVFAALTAQMDELQAMLGGLSNDQALFRDAPQEWSIKEVLGHLNDTERVFAYRAFRISRNDKVSLPGFDQNDYVREAGFDSQPMAELLEEFMHQRRANILLIQNMSEQATLRVGTASGNPLSARAAIHILVGHVEHHVASLNEKYLPNLKS